MFSLGWYLFLSLISLLFLIKEEISLSNLEKSGLLLLENKNKNRGVIIKARRMSNNTNTPFLSDFVKVKYSLKKLFKMLINFFFNKTKLTIIKICLTIFIVLYGLI